MENMTNDNYAIYTRGLVRDFGPVRAVDGIALDVHEGEVFGFLGPNGAGKTTVVRMLITLLYPTSGEIWVAGHDVLREPNEVRLKNRSCATRGGPGQQADREGVAAAARQTLRANR